MRLVTANAGGPQTLLSESWANPKRTASVNLSPQGFAPVRADNKDVLQIDLGFEFRWLEAFRFLNITRFQKLDRYLQQQAADHTIAVNAVETFKTALFEFLSTLGIKYGVPDACPGPDGQMIYYWKKPSSSIQLDVTASGYAELYYLDSTSNTDVLVEYQVGQLSSEVSKTPKALRLFA